MASLEFCNDSENTFFHTHCDDWLPYRPVSKFRHKKRGLNLPHLSLMVVGNLEDEDVGIAAHAIA